MLASLNHPNIAQIHGIEKSDDTQALVLELVEGPTLADRVAKGPIPLDEALPIAKQIAEALEAAHEQGIIHRDLKPANVKVKADGMVKVLDFGLAKAFQPEASGASASESPTISLTAAATQMGMVIGTAAYMAPEQARGKPVDKRADIWAFGVVLYEMLAGARPFAGEDVSLTLASVMKSNVDVRTLPRHVPATARTVIRGCLEKNPSQRIRDIGDVRLAMEGTFESTQAAGDAAPAFSFWQRPIPAVALAVSIAALAGLSVWGITRSDPLAPRVARFTIRTPPDAPLWAGGSSDVAISPDGTQIAYVTQTDAGPQVYLRGLGQLDATPLPGTERGSNPFFSADGALPAKIVETLHPREFSVEGGEVSGS